MHIRKTLELGIRGGLTVGLGAALADGVYGFIAGAGVTTVSNALLDKDVFIKLIGGIFLLYLALKELRAPLSPRTISATPRKKLIKLTSYTFFLTLTSPFTILSFIAIFASIGGTDVTFKESLWMVLGIFLGSMSWWIILGVIIVKIKHYLSEGWINRIRYGSTLILGGFGAWAIIAAMGRF